VLFALGAIWLLVHPSALRDQSREPRPYSFSRVQLWWWTIVILPSWIVIWAMRNEFWPFNTTCLVLLGLSGTTTLAARIIDDRDRQNPRVVRHQDEPDAEQGFFEDILSDEQGVSIHRFQALVFNLAFSLGFLLETFKDLSKNAFPTFDAATLSLLGLSSATYVAIKAKENAEKPAEIRAAAPLPSLSDEVLDPGGYDDAVPDN
jgi:hypothetical protein